MYSGKIVTDAYNRHKQFINQYLYYHTNGYEQALSLSKKVPEQYITEKEILENHHRFVRTEKDDADPSWEARLAKKYYDRLFKEYCLCDLSKYKKGKIALRWRIQSEVISGKGHLMCGNLECSSTDSLTSWELPFGYMENNEKKYALVKVRLCPPCSDRLHYYKRKSNKQNQTSSSSSSSSASSLLTTDPPDTHFTLSNQDTTISTRDDTQEHINLEPSSSSSLKDSSQVNSLKKRKRPVELPPSSSSSLSSSSSSSPLNPVTTKQNEKRVSVIAKKKKMEPLETDDEIYFRGLFL